MQQVWKTAYEARVPHVCNATTGLCARNLARARIPIPVQLVPFSGTLHSVVKSPLRFYYVHNITGTTPKPKSTVNSCAIIVFDLH
jgi:hypothetical protein